MRPVRSVLFCLVLSLPLLAGCTLMDRLTGGGPAESGQRPADSSRAEAPHSADAPGADSRKAALPPAEPADPKSFLTLSGSEVAARLGPPDLLRRDGTAEVRQYRSPACTLDLFLYPSDGDTLAVRHAELRGAGLDARGRQLCLGEMLQARALTG